LWVDRKDIQYLRRDARHSLRAVREISGEGSGEMSGGSFDYAYFRVARFSDDLQMRIDANGESDRWGQKPDHFEQPAIEKLREIVKDAKRTAALMREAEWLYSGDTSEDSFLRRVAEIEADK